MPIISHLTFIALITTCNCVNFLFVSYLTIYTSYYTISSIRTATFFSLSLLAESWLTTVVSKINICWTNE